MASDYPNPYENTGYEDYRDPYSVNQDDSAYESNCDYGHSDHIQTSYNNGDLYTQGSGFQHSSSRQNHENSIDGAEYTNEDSYGSEDSYGHYRDNFVDNGSRNGDQDERDRRQRKNRSERRREMRSGDSSRSDDRDRGRDRDNRYERDRRDRLGDERAGEKWLTDQPTNTIILRGLPDCIEEKDIKAELMMFGAPIRDVRLMRKSSGVSRGFAFVEFQKQDDAQRWMEINQKTLVLQNKFSCAMNFSTPKDPKDKQMAYRMDWTCVKCGVHNFKRRDNCFKCHVSRYESGNNEVDGYEHVGTNPCNTLLFRGLDAHTTEENLLRALNHVTQLTCKNIQVVIDPATQASRCFAFIELPSVADSVNVFETLKSMNPQLEVDGKLVLVSYAKNTFNTSIATIAAAAQSWETGSAEYYGQGYDYSGQYDQSSGYYYDGQNYDYSAYYSTETTATTGTTTDSTNAAAAVAQAAIQQAQAVKHYQKQVEAQHKLCELSAEEKLAQQATAWKHKTNEKQQPSSSATATGVQEYAKYPAPDVSLYQYDETSGFYYDPVTALYYDANTQYYYNSTTGQYMYWDAEQSTYLPAPGGDETNTATTDDGKDNKKEGKDKKEKVKVAKKIAKDMEKWAKSMNAQKEALKDGMKKITLPNLSGRKESAAADAGFAILEKTKHGAPEDKRLMPPPPTMGSEGPAGGSQAGTGLVASYGGDSDDDEDDEASGTLDESKLLDMNKMACLLCKRQFQTKDQVLRHSQMSDLHKQNLEKLRGSTGSSGNSGGMQYRDRAKERREKIGSQAPPAKKRPPTAPEPFDQPTKAGLTEDNIGNKLLQKMGWSAGQGLGRTGQGIVNPIEAERRNQSAGLGMRGSKSVIEDAANYKDALKKTLFARYNELD